MTSAQQCVTLFERKTIGQEPLILLEICVAER